MSPRELERCRLLLCRLQDHVRDALMASRAKQARNFARVAAVTADDTIYHIDRLSEHAILDWFERHWPRAWPVEIVMEGLAGGTVTFPAEIPVSHTVLKCILDPIDGTRNIMHDKRSAWILAAMAPQRGARTNLRDIVVAAMTEIPTTKQWRADQLSAVRGRGVKAEAVDVISGRRSAIEFAPSRARDCRDGFAAISRFFPEGKALLAQLEEELWDELYGLGKQASPLVFDDQYICSGGQIYELIVGHDRFLADLRPLVFRKLGLTSALVCHPYDICTALIATEAGCVIEAPLGGPLKQPLDTSGQVAWVGYANPSLARHIRPVLRRLIRQML
ncbi:MAG TPA: inositol monophosphatase [Lacunisphaera sp.]|nr:inositol monophosphatase [Lacunisphaera sp.]